MKVQILKALAPFRGRGLGEGGYSPDSRIPPAPCRCAAFPLPLKGARGLFATAALIALAACGGAKFEPRRMESDAELQKVDEQEFNATPDMQLAELRDELHKLGITDQEISETVEENDVPIFMLTLDDAKFDKLDKAAMAKLQLDSRYRFDLKDRDQVRKFAHFSVAENTKRTKAEALRYLAKNGEMGKFPRYREGTPMVAYARALEHYCGYDEGEALNVIDGRWLEYRHRMVDKAVEDQGGRHHGMASFKCLVRIVYATDLQPHFIGNRSQIGKTNI
jgi:hypothetical protein